MNITRQLFRLALLGAIDHQITHTVVVGSVFANFRQFCKNCQPWLGKLVTCQLCLGTWVGIVLALLFQPRFVEPGQPGRPAREPRLVRRLAAFIGDAFAIALASRFYTEVLAILAGQAAVQQEHKRVLAEQEQPGVLAE